MPQPDDPREPRTAGPPPAASAGDTATVLEGPRRPLTSASVASTVASGPEGRIDDVDAELSNDEGFAGRYARGAQLGEGGMGEVWLCKDQRVGRHVAMKVIRPGHGSRSDLRRRFLREVRVQGQLEHPSIVPVYDLGRDPGGAAYFTMKRVRGLTLEQVIAKLRADDAETVKEQTRFKRLAAFSSVCLAVHFAHARGVVHRDLKPGNIMLGDFGEVHVLDWGLAKVTGVPELAREDESALDVTKERPAATVAGTMMGTPGYMAPEQVMGEGVGPAADVYALGAILYEVLALVPLHPPGSSEQVLAATLAGADVHSAAARAQREVPPELEAVCARATALDPRDRYPTARAMQEEVERFLNGDRDLERRRALSREHAQAAADAAARALAGDGALEERGRAMREVSRAVALDPQNSDAMDTLVRLLTQPPRDLPEEARAELHAAAAEWQRRGARTAGFAYLSWAVYAPIGVLMGVRSWPAALILDALWLVAAALTFQSSRRPHPEGRTPMAVILTSNLAIAGSASLFGPFILAPALAAANTLAFVVGADKGRRVPAVVCGCAAFVAPLVCEGLGVGPRSMTFRDGALVLLPRVLSFDSPAATLFFLVVANVALLVTAAVFVARFKDTLVRTEERLYMHTWHLRQFVPNDARSALVSTAPDPLDERSLEDRIRRHRLMSRARRAAK